MAMSRNILIILGGGLLIAVLVAVLVNASLSGGKPKQVVKKEPRVKVVVASKNIRIGQELTEENITWKDWPKGAVYTGMVVKEADHVIPTDAVSGRVKRDIYKDEPVLSSAMVDSDAGNFLAAALTPGKRAIAIRVNAQSMAGGFVTPGDFVDIILTYNYRLFWSGDEDMEQYARNIINSNIDTLASETILQNIKVLAVDQTARRKDDKIKVGKTVTIEVDTQQAEMLAVASDMGDLSLSLRGIGDDLITEYTNRPVVTDARITRVQEDVNSIVMETLNTAGQVERNIRIFSGSSVQDVPIK